MATCTLTPITKKADLIPLHQFCNVVLYAIIAIISVIMVIGKLLFGFVLGSITSTLANADSQKVQYDEKVQAVKVTVRISDLFCSSCPSNEIAL